MAGPDLDIVQPPRGSVIREWQKNWYCYWDNSYGMPSDPETNFVFKPPLELSSCGVVRTRGDDWEEREPEENISSSICSVIDLMEEAIDEKGDDYACVIGRGSESDGKWIPFAVRWSDADGDLTAEALLKKIGAHTKLQESIHAWEFSNEEEEEEEEEDYGFFEKKLKTFFSGHESFIYFCCGDGKLNPVPCFAVAQICPGLVAGFVGGVVYT